MRVHYLQHVPFEDLGSIKPWLIKKGCNISSTRFFEKPEFPDPQEIDFLIVLGGPMSVNDVKKFPRIQSENRLIREGMELQTPVLGICLGAQLIASALGSDVYANPVKEIGWFPVNGVPNKEGSTFQFPAKFECFHWHGETFNLPANSRLLAKSLNCRNQAFQIGNTVIGLQFHLEVTPNSVQNLVTNCQNELVSSPTIQSSKMMLSAKKEKFHKINHLMNKVLSFLMDKKS